MIGERAFEYCDALESVQLPASLQTIGASAFARSKSLSNVVFLGPAPSVSGDPFLGYGPDPKALVSPEHVESFGGEGAYWNFLRVVVAIIENRPAPDPTDPPSTVEYGSLMLAHGTSFELGSNETLVLSDGPLTIQDGAIFEGNGSIIGNVLNLGLLILRVTDKLILPAITNTTGVVSLSRSGGSGGPSPVIPEVSNDAVFSTDGSLEVTGTFTQGSTGKLRLFIEGDDPGVTYSQLSVGDHIDLDGEVQLVMGWATFDEFYLIPGKTFDVVRLAPGAIGKTLTVRAGLDFRILAVEAIQTRLSIQGLSTSAFDSGHANDPDSLVELDSTLFTWEVVDDSILRATYAGPGIYLVEPEIAEATRELSGIGGGIFSGLDLSFDTLRVTNANTGRTYEFVFGDLGREVDFAVTEITETTPVPQSTDPRGRAGRGDAQWLGLLRTRF